MKLVHARIEEETHTRLKQIWAAGGPSMSEQVRQALEHIQTCPDAQKKVQGEGIKQ